LALASLFEFPVVSVPSQTLPALSGEVRGAATALASCGEDGNPDAVHSPVSVDQFAEYLL
jgi:hypothetical protein